MRKKTWWYLGNHYPLDDPLLRVNGIGIREKMTAPGVDRPIGTGDYLAMFFHQGMELATHEGVINVSANRIIIWIPGQRQYYYHRDSVWCHSWIHLTGEHVQHCLSRCVLPINTPLEWQAEAFEGHLAGIHGEINHPTNANQAIVRNLVENCFQDLVRSIDPNSVPHVPTEFFELKDYLSRHYMEHWTLAKMADFVNLSVSHFCLRFRCLFGMTPIEFLISQRMHQALYLLRDRNYSVSQVGEQVGYTDLFHFSRQFKKRFGLSPREMRKQFGKEHPPVAKN